MRSKSQQILVLLIGFAFALPSFAGGYEPGKRVLLDAHNCYPYQGRWNDRIDRALASGLPVAIEQDLVWLEDESSGEYRSIVSHGAPYTGEEPSLAEYFFERIRPIVEKALTDGDSGDWPLITLNLDFKQSPAAHGNAVFDVLKDYEDWLTTAKRNKNENKKSKLKVRPVLVLLGSQNSLATVFHNNVPIGEPILAFGACNLERYQRGQLSQDERRNLDATVAPNLIVKEPATNYRRWWNNPWGRVEAGGQRNADEWTDIDMKRLEEMTSHAHELGYWIRFYTLNGHEKNEMGWGGGYNFGSLSAVQQRWKAVRDAGVDFVATDMYEEFSKSKH
jgi:hypothetical protein